MTRGSEQQMVILGALKQSDRTRRFHFSIRTFSETFHQKKETAKQNATMFSPAVILNP